jgi:hypothetical protein
MHLLSCERQAPLRITRPRLIREWVRPAVGARGTGRPGTASRTAHPLPSAAPAGAAVTSPDRMARSMLPSSQRFSAAIHGRTGSGAQRLAHSVQAGLPRRIRIGHAVLVGEVFPDPAVLLDLLQQGNRGPFGFAAPSAAPAEALASLSQPWLALLKWCAGLTALWTGSLMLVVLPGLGSATPIRQSRVTISVS